MNAARQRHPPALRVAVAPQPRLQALIVALAMLSTAAAVAALAAHMPRLGWLWLVLPLVGAAAWQRAAVPPCHLQWDGQTWRLARPELPDPGMAVEIEVVLDFGAWLLLRARLPRRWWPRHRYLPLSRRHLGAAWGALRATLYAARPEPVAEPGPPPA